MNPNVRTNPSTWATYLDSRVRSDNWTSIKKQPRFQWLHLQKQYSEA